MKKNLLFEGKKITFGSTFWIKKITFGIWCVCLGFLQKNHIVTKSFCISKIKRY